MILNKRTYRQFFLVSLLGSHVVNAATNAHSPWEFEFGNRYWLATNNYSLNLFNSDAQLFSRLTYSNVTSNIAEGFWRLEHSNGVFIKGYFGGGSNNNGQFIDQDFPPGIIYSRTHSNQKYGAINYFSADLGYTFLTKNRWKAGAYIGYHYWLEHYTTYGCAQTAPGGTICTEPPIPYTVNGLNDNFTWNSLRVGINSTVGIIDRLSFVIDAAYTRANLSGNDYHNLRSSIRGVFEDGGGNGVQLEGVFNWQLTPNLTAGVGGRWWYVSTNGNAHFEQTAASAEPEPITVNQSTYGLLLQTSYKFDDSSDPKFTKDPLIFDWRGAYLGTNIGYGSNPSSVFITPLSAAAFAIGQQTPSLLNVQSMGFVGGGQAGYNWQLSKVIAGIEGDMDYANLSGANATTLEGPPNFSSSVSKNLQWLATLRARIGALASENFLAYATAGPAWGSAELAFDQRNVGAVCSIVNLCSTGNATKTKTGGSVGAGVEYAVSSKYTFKMEYLYVNLGNTGLNTAQDTFGNISYNISAPFAYNIVRLGVNYKL